MSDNKPLKETETMKTNEELQKDVQDAMKWEPLLNAAEIGVTAKNGIITLTGTVNSYAKKSEAEKAAKNVTGVKAVAEEIEIRFDSNGKKTDTQIAAAVLTAFAANWEIPDDKISVKVEGGWVTLEGELKWNFQKDAAKKSVNNLSGVLGVINNIAIKADSPDEVERKGIERALERNWSIGDQDIRVKVSGSKVTLNGTVHSFYERDEADRIAWNAPGVCMVDNELVIEYAD
jgi:osmotically-inducible protein OsmY